MRQLNPAILPAATLFLAATLLFTLQLMLGRQMLPALGGTAMGWLALMLFFQVALLVGYGLAWGLSLLPAQRHAAIWFALLVCGAGFLPPVFTTPGELLSAGDVMQALLPTAFMPGLVLGLAASTVQRLYAYRLDNPYRLYAASNAGSFFGLLCYPLLIEPLLGLSVQPLVWSVGYGLLTLLVALMLTTIRQTASHKTKEETSTAHTTKLSSLRWIFLAALPVLLSYGLSAQINLSMGSFPLFWIVPLGLYLLSFVWVFSAHAPTGRGLTLAIWLMAVLCATVLSATQMSGHLLPLWATLALWPLFFFLLAAGLHGQLAATRPQASQLSGYYFWIATGGALGGGLAVYVVPAVFPYPLEFPVIAALSLLALPLPAGLLRRGLRTLAATFALMVFVSGWLLATLPPHKAVRNFYGPAFIFDTADQAGVLTRYLSTGEGLQSSQPLVPEPSREPALYFKHLTAIFTPERGLNHIGMLGAGAGMALCLTAPGRDFTIYELDPKMRQIAEQDFYYTRNCGTPRWRMGDGRLLLERDKQERYDALIIDAFHGANMPLHLITREALTVYSSRLSPRGLLFYNINTKYYDLIPQLGAQAAAQGWQMWQAQASWVVLADSRVDLSWLAALGWSQRGNSDTPDIWTDEKANLLGAIRFNFP